MTLLWRTADLRSVAPSPLDEVRTALAFFDETLFGAVPRLLRSIDGALDGGAQAQISTEQRTQIRQTVMRVGDAPRVSSVNFSLSVGTVVPRTVKYVLLPPRVVEIYPAWRGYHFFIVGDQIVIVEPGSLRIVAVIPA